MDSAKTNFAGKDFVSRFHLTLAWLLLAAVFPVAIHAQPASDFTYTTANNQITITGYTGSPDQDITIPGTINGLPVTGIGDQAFYYELYASVTIPASVTSIGDGAFAGPHQQAIIVAPQNTVYTSVNGVLFNKKQTTLVAYPGGSDSETYTIPDIITTVGDYAFAGASALSNVTISSSVTAIGDSAFAGCENLGGIAIPNSVTSIGDSAFYEDPLDSLTIGTSVNTIGDYAFYGGDLGSVTIPNSVTTIGIEAFASNNLTSLTIGKSVTLISAAAFIGSPSLRSTLFLGNAPTTGRTAFDPSLVTVDYYTGAAGFTSPTWTDSSGDTYSSVNLGYSPSASAQAITFPAIANQVYGATFETGATASSGLPVTYSWTGPVTISGNTVTVNGVGTVSIRAHQNGNVDYKPAPTVLQRFTATQAAQTITFPAIGNQVYPTGSIKLNATSSSGLTVTYTKSGPATISGNTLTITGTGSVTVGAHQAGNTDYLAAPEARQTFTVSKAQ